MKDFIDIAGLETGCGNRCYRNLYPIKKSTAKCVEQLIKAGAIFLGKTKTTQVSDGQTPTEWFGYLVAFHVLRTSKVKTPPRGDGCQKPSGSSTGSAVACAAYDWIDFSIGTDTGGSIRHPAGVNGICGSRPSLKLSLEELSLSPLMDTIGIFTLSALMLEAVSKVIYRPCFGMTVPTSPKLKYRLLCLVRSQLDDCNQWFPLPDGSGDATAAETEIFNLEDLWAKARPSGQSKIISKATGKIYQVLAYHRYLETVTDPFIADYQAAQKGRKPFIEPILRARHEHTRQIAPIE
ncbi:MAG: hypothetical protein MMC33_008561 [Icmadophila ericetorum]|nr:hypothetical protein [Icmadophila ericetorum]